MAERCRIGWLEGNWFSGIPVILGVWLWPRKSFVYVCWYFSVFIHIWGFFLRGLLRPSIHVEVVSAKILQGVTPILIGGFLVISFQGFFIFFLFFLTNSYAVVAWSFLRIQAIFYARFMSGVPPCWNIGGGFFIFLSWVFILVTVPTQVLLVFIPFFSLRAFFWWWSSI